QAVVAVSIQAFPFARQDRAAPVAVHPALAVVGFTAVEDLHDEWSALDLAHAVAVDVDESVAIADPHQDGEAQHVQHVEVAAVARLLAPGQDANLTAGDRPHRVLRPRVLAGGVAGSGDLGTDLLGVRAHEAGPPAPAVVALGMDGGP